MAKVIKVASMSPWGEHLEKWGMFCEPDGCFSFEHEKDLMSSFQFVEGLAVLTLGIWVVGNLFMLNLLIHKC